MQGQREQGVTDLTREGNTDSGNSYSLTYKNNKVQISVTCSEVVPVDENAEAETAATEEAASEVQTETTTTTKTITAGANQAEAAEESAAETSEAAAE